MAKKVATYLWDQKSSGNLKSQVADLDKFCKMRSWNIVKQFRDSGYRDPEGPNEFSELIEYASEGKCDVILVRNLTSFGTSLQEALARLIELENEGVHFASVQEEIDTTSQFKEEFFATVRALSEIDYINSSIQIKRGLESAQKNGVQIGRPPVPKDDVRTVIRLRDDNEGAPKGERLSPVEIQHRARVSKTTYYRIIHVVEELQNSKGPPDLAQIKSKNEVSDRMFQQILKAYQEYYPEEEIA